MVDVPSPDDDVDRVVALLEQTPEQEGTEEPGAGGQQNPTRDRAVICLKCWQLGCFEDEAGVSTHHSVFDLQVLAPKGVERLPEAKLRVWRRRAQLVKKLEELGDRDLL